MARIIFTPNLERFFSCPEVSAEGRTVRELFDALASTHPRLARYFLDDQGSLRPHVAVFVDGKQVKDRLGLSDPVGGDSEVYLLQALSGGRI